FRVCQCFYFLFCMVSTLPSPPLFPYTTLFRSYPADRRNLGVHIRSAFIPGCMHPARRPEHSGPGVTVRPCGCAWCCWCGRDWCRSEEHTSELQSRFDLVCRLLLVKKNNMY